MIVYSEKSDSVVDLDVDSPPPSPSTPLLPRRNSNQTNTSSRTNTSSLLTSYLRLHSSYCRTISPSEPVASTPPTSHCDFSETMQLKPDSPPPYAASASNPPDITDSNLSTRLPSESSPTDTPCGLASLRHRDHQLMRTISPYSHAGNNYLTVRRLTSIQGHYAINVDIPSSLALTRSIYQHAEDSPPNLWLESNADIDAIVSLIGDGSTSNRCNLQVISHGSDVKLAFQERRHSHSVPLDIRATTKGRGEIATCLPPNFRGILRISVSSPKKFWFNPVIISSSLWKRATLASAKTVAGRRTEEYCISALDQNAGPRMEPEDIRGWAGDVLEVQLDFGQARIYDDGEAIDTTWMQNLRRYLNLVLC
ncbi:hypothetical protein FRC03_000865 [Tulasnella sp. 419]|nr:hypothetical protein FRC03_000865 [Tulasnella sp. 419]